MLIATWNVNSIRKRLPLVLDWIKRVKPDVLCLQETLVEDFLFPRANLENAGYAVANHGQKRHNGVALLARTPISDVETGLGHGASDSEARLIAGTVQNIRIINVYVPNGRKLTHPSCATKKIWMQQLRMHLDARYTKSDSLIVAGDFNIAPHDIDVSAPSKSHGTVYAHPSMRALLTNTLDFGFVDVFAAHHSEAGMYSWWPYNVDGYKTNRGGLRIDLILATPSIATRVQSATIDHAEREKQGPSDHAPVIVTLR